MTYEFPVVLRGEGVNILDAWNNAVEAFSQDPGVPPDVEPEKDEGACPCGEDH